MIRVIKRPSTRLEKSYFKYLIVLRVLTLPQLRQRAIGVFLFSKTKKSTKRALSTIVVITFRQYRWQPLFYIEIRIRLGTYYIGTSKHFQAHYLFLKGMTIKNNL